MRAMGHPVGEQRVRVGPREESVLAVSWRLTYPWNLLGLPAVTLPIATGGQGLPIGLQIAVPAFAEASIHRAAKTLEDLHGTWPRTTST